MKAVQGQADLLQVVLAGGAAGGFAGGLHRRQQQRDQHADDGDHDQQFNERKGLAAFHGAARAFGECQRSPSMEGMPLFKIAARATNISPSTCNGDAMFLPWILGSIGVLLGLYGLHLVMLRVQRWDWLECWHRDSGGGSSYIPLQEIYQPQIRHVIEVREQNLSASEDHAGDPPTPAAQPLDGD